MTQRNYGIDLLRLLLMYMVCVLHTLGQGGILVSCNSSLYWLLEVFAYCAVDAFAIISGYMANISPSKKQNYSKIVNMWFQAVFYSFFITLILTLLKINPEWSISDIRKSLLPVTYCKFWYFTAYFALFFTIPILNKFIYSIDKNMAKKAFVIIAFLFSIISFTADPFKTGNGYSALWLFVLYCIGALAKKIELFKSWKTVYLALFLALSTITTWILHTFLGFGIFLNYTSPTILLNAILLVIVFSRLQFNCALISKISALAFGIYLFQMNSVIYYDKLRNAFTFVAAKNKFIGITYVLLISLGIFLAGLTVEFIRNKLANLLRIPELSKKIVILANKVVTKSTILLK